LFDININEEFPADQDQFPIDDIFFFVILVAIEGNAMKKGRLLDTLVKTLFDDPKQEGLIML